MTPLTPTPLTMTKLVVALFTVTLFAMSSGAAPLSAQPKAPPPLAGSYVGTASVPLGDSTIVVPVSYTFTTTNGVTNGVAMVPGQGSGAISMVVRDGARIRFRVTAPENKLLEHDGTIGASGAIEGFVNLDNKPLARFKIAPGKLQATPPAPKGKSSGV